MRNETHLNNLHLAYSEDILRLGCRHELWHCAGDYLLCPCPLQNVHKCYRRYSPLKEHMMHVHLKWQQSVYAFSKNKIQERKNKIKNKDWPLFSLLLGKQQVSQSPLETECIHQPYLPLRTTLIQMEKKNIFPIKCVEISRCTGITLLDHSDRWVLRPVIIHLILSLPT